ncbi:MAG: DUF5050 domain-containing protein [Lachnospiraceae bacterium]|nr:DUF5050 domain-containing protein [Lachnospiraceae bacterium]
MTINTVGSTTTLYPVIRLIMKRRILYVILIITLIITVSCNKKESDEPISDQFYLDMLVNTYLSGGVTYDDNNIYYCVNDSIWSVNKNGNSNKKLCDVDASDIWHNNGTIYYIDEAMSICSLDLKKLTIEKVIDYKVDNFYIIEDVIYFENDNKLLQFNFETKEYKTIIEDVAYTFTDGKKIFYEDLNSTLYCTDFEGNSPQKLMENLFTSPFIHGGYLYINTKLQYVSEYRIPLDDLEVVEPYEIPNINPVEYEGYIYCKGEKRNIKTNESEMYEEKEVTHTWVAENNLIYRAVEDMHIYYKMLNMDTGKSTIIQSYEIESLTK